MEKKQESGRLPASVFPVWEFQKVCQPGTPFRKQREENHPEIKEKESVLCENPKLEEVRKQIVLQRME